MRENVRCLVKRRWHHVCTLATGGMFIAVLSAGCGERENWLEVERPTEVRLIEQLSPSPGSASTGVEPGKVVATLKPGETARVVAVYHG